jgi:hypothetical protein
MSSLREKLAFNCKYITIRISAYRRKRVFLASPEAMMHGITLPSDSQFQRLILVVNAVLGRDVH